MKTEIELLDEKLSSQIEVKRLTRKIRSSQKLIAALEFYLGKTIDYQI